MAKIHHERSRSAPMLEITPTGIASPNEAESNGGELVRHRTEPGIVLESLAEQVDDVDLQEEARDDVSDVAEPEDHEKEFDDPSDEEN
jgi:hypothetical protein